MYTMADATATGGLTRESLGVIVLAIAVILGITLLGAFKTTGLIDNTIVDTFITGLGYFGTFIGVIVITVIVAGLLVLIIAVMRRFKE